MTRESNQDAIALALSAFSKIELDELRHQVQFGLISFITIAEINYATEST